MKALDIKALRQFVTLIRTGLVGHALFQLALCSGNHVRKVK